MINRRYLISVIFLFLGLFALEAILSAQGIDESYAFLVYWVVFFFWLIFGKSILKKRYR
jgi:hypothetical protein